MVEIMALIVGVVGAIPVALLVRRWIRKRFPSGPRRAMAEFRRKADSLVDRVSRLSQDGKIGRDFRDSLVATWQQELQRHTERLALTPARPDEIARAIAEPSPTKVDPGWAATVAGELCKVVGLYKGHFHWPERYCSSLGLDVLRVLGNSRSLPSLSSFLVQEVMDAFGARNIGKVIVVRRAVPPSNPTELLEDLRTRLGAELITVGLEDMWPTYALGARNPLRDKEILHCHKATTLIIDPLPVGDGLLRTAALYFKQKVLADVVGLVVLFGVSRIDPLGGALPRGVPRPREIMTFDLGAAELKACAPGKPVPGHPDSGPIELPLF